MIAAAAVYVATPRVFRPLAVAGFALWSPAFRLFGPTPFGELYPGWVAVATILVLFFLVAVLLARDPADPDEQLRRIGLGVLAVAIISRISERHFVVASLAIAPDEVWALVVVAVLPILAIVRMRRSLRDALATGVALAGYLLVGLALILGKAYHVDSVVVVHRAAELLLTGADPYRELNVAEALRHFGLDPALATHLEDGSQLATYNYPALSFLVPAPFIALGLTDIRFIYLAEILVLALILIRAVRVPVAAAGDRGHRRQRRHRPAERPRGSICWRSARCLPDDRLPLVACRCCWVSRRRPDSQRGSSDRSTSSRCGAGPGGPRRCGGQRSRWSLERSRISRSSSGRRRIS